MKKVLLTFSILTILLPVASFAAYTRTPAGTATSTNFVFHIGSSADLTDWNGAASNSWWYVFGRIDVNDPIDGGSNHGVCHDSTTNINETITAATLGFATGSQIAGVHNRQFSSGICTGAVGDGNQEGAATFWTGTPPTASIFEFNSTSTATSTETSSTIPFPTKFTEVCVVATSTTSTIQGCYNPSKESFYNNASVLLIEIFLILDCLVFIGALVAVYYGWQKYVHRDWKKQK